MKKEQWLETIVVENEDGKFLALANDVLGQHLSKGLRWEEHYSRIMPVILPRGATAIDVGACIGYTSVLMAKTVGPTGKVLSFEPMRLMFQQLCANVALNGLTNVYTLNLALGHADNVTVSMVSVDYFEKDVNVMNACIGTGGDLVTMRTLDSFGLSNISLLKIDVQGCETYVLRGAAEMIKANRPTILIEIEEPQLKNQNTSPTEVMALLFSHNYVLVRLLGDFLYDFICVPAEKRASLPEIVEAAGMKTEILDYRDGDVQIVSLDVAVTAQ